jgi:spore germination cell wall hydrolase CwlJ-like protein
LKFVSQARAEGRAPIGAALAGAGVGLGLGALFLAGGMAGHAAEHARAQRIAEVAADAYAGAAALSESRSQGLSVGLARYGAATNGDAQVVASRYETIRGTAAARRQSDLDCLTQAIYYEARGESARGQAAVAQVVLNRVKHPAFPRTVCGVVYQGASRKACQFSFACDGSMNRRREAAAWKRARDLAKRALAGALGAEVGSATHFHTTAVSPAWAPQMLRVASVGTHIFYKFAPRRAKAQPEAEPAPLVLASAAAVDAADLRVVPALALEKVAEASLEAKPAAASAEAGAAQPAEGKAVKSGPAKPSPAAAAAKAAPETPVRKASSANAAAPVATDAAALTAPRPAAQAAS